MEHTDDVDAAIADEVKDRVGLVGKAATADGDLVTLAGRLRIARQPIELRVETAQIGVALGPAHCWSV